MIPASTPPLPLVSLALVAVDAMLSLAEGIVLLVLENVVALCAALVPATGVVEPAIELASERLALV